MRPVYICPDANSHEQCDTETSFGGGIPRLPENARLPVCGICGETQTFFFQIAFPRHHAWHGSSLAVFQCTACRHRDHPIPEMLPPQRGLVIPPGYLATYQTNYRFPVFETAGAVPRPDYTPKIVYRRWSLQHTGKGAAIVQVD